MIQSYIDKENDSGCAMEAEEDSAFQYCIFIKKLNSSFTKTIQHIAWIHPPQDGNLF